MTEQDKTEQDKSRPAPRLVFKDPFEQQTGDDTDRGWGEASGRRGLDWYLDQRPPHHGEK
ncbi:hypothetical protein [Kitasatospora sp. CB01950]|uniref:hypothetical protein n=1 Tax=Kitasatospora sp. CB01950 TaxID=1703930 RepID=UPI00093FB0C1|nr:hypothetical protein [Kitasatospora sp. CB01950]OKJ11817.1 hypothetical protein AMK19_13305 [Kitasatospora sp. CB01950]